MHCALVPEERKFTVPLRHPSLSFDDGNIAILCGTYYFIVHQGLLCRHSEVLEHLVRRLLNEEHVGVIEGRPVLNLDDAAEDLAYFVEAIYDGLGRLRYDGNDFLAVSGLLRLCTKYHVHNLRQQLLRGLSVLWPTTLSQWEQREKLATDSSGLYAPRPMIPHPITVINLAREIDAPQLLPSAYYDLSRYLPSQTMSDFSPSDDCPTEQLSHEDLVNALRGREYSARFFSTFVVNELEGRPASPWCMYRNEQKPSRRRRCQMAFEAITFEVLRDVNGVACNRNSDPLYAIADTYLMQTKDDAPGQENKTAFRACEACRLEYNTVVDRARTDFWRQLPQWFGVTVANWNQQAQP
ncbi:hypothetical protein GLOTRDRAFT_39275 [Gloeophyllum trabeum ATCC 11539]|uniref:BTB domain-containing protein n=1 Tax=Gloeophyllum trabeum (strain ATCC 11539 / FP-39264 / Madison 617) TaxID=670483 RepID=S7RVX1_GLOTA|nr:uncharacterized protein GLOTRDRAFT_39275 [Gloeophyllum trabeum ATCC 11539]EPQ57434.1 hypothetical protein GLOTRDRAFT_39275 [Gloeophyllum trabeum ATCC 11539]